MTTSTRIQPEHLPASIRGYLAAHEAGDAETALRTFSATAVVVDEDITYRGTEEVRRFLTKAGTQYTYTATLVAAERVDDAHWVATLHLEGDFPGGVVDLRYRFAMHGDCIAGLVIAP